MTLSLVHVHPRTGTAAAITATAGMAVGGYVDHAWRGCGACATQGLATNPWYAERIRRLLEAGHAAQTALDAIVSDDPEADLRQCLVMDARGRAAVHSGSANLPAVSTVLRPTVAAAGNLLADAAVIDAMMRGFLEATCDDADDVMSLSATETAPRYRADYEGRLLESLIEALAAAFAAGGDVRGARSAALRIESFSCAPLDLRLDWVERDLLGELTRLAERVRARSFADFLDSLPTH